jgi:hypothetical protein
MAARKAQRKLNKQTVHDEFHVRTAKVLRELLEPEEVLDGDKWLFVNGNNNSLVIVRKREIVEIFPDEPEEEEVHPVEVLPEEEVIP